MGNEADLSPYAQALTDKLGGDHELFHAQLAAYNLGLQSKRYYGRAVCHHQADRKTGVLPVRC